jgi:hypothetical protein
VVFGAGKVKGRAAINVLNVDVNGCEEKVEQK